MNTCTNESLGNQTIAQAMVSIGPRTVEGDQGRVSMYGMSEIIQGIEYQRKRDKLKNRATTAAVLRTISNHRLATHDGRAS